MYVKVTIHKNHILALCTPQTSRLFAVYRSSILFCIVVSPACVCVYMCVCVCVRACVRSCVRVCVRACVRVRARVRAAVPSVLLSND